MEQMNSDGTGRFLVFTEYICTKRNNL